MGIGRSKVQIDKELKKKNEEKIKSDNKNVSEENIKKFIDELLKNEEINMRYLPDSAEKELYVKVFLLFMNVLSESLKKTDINFLNHKLEITIKPIKK
jgi:hypothetical protein